MLTAGGALLWTAGKQKKFILIVHLPVCPPVQQRRPGEAGVQ